MIIRSVELETVIGVTSAIPESRYPEVAFAGKSNVGKSSLINTLMNRKALARVSAQPGKTQTINYYNINEAMYLVDLPGYGYAKAGEEIKAQWGQMIETYLHTSEALRAVFLLIDIRHEPSDNDCLMYDWMVEQGFAPIIIATKADKIAKGRIKEHIQRIERTLHVMPDTRIIPFSAETKQGREEIWSLVDELVDWVEPEKTKQATGESEALKRQSNPGNENGQQSGSRQNNSDSETDAPKKKERWKKTDRPVAKKTAKKQAAKKAAGKR